MEPAAHPGRHLGPGHARNAITVSNWPRPKQPKPETAHLHGIGSRLLPARVVVYYVLAMCLFFGDAYEEVMRLLVAGLLFTGAWQKDWQVPTTGAIAQARQRLGAAPLQLLFERVAVPCAQRGTRGNGVAFR